MARPLKALLSQEIIGQAAIQLVDSGRELQVVPLAKQLGVSVSSLYHHVDGREGIIRAMRQVMVSEYKSPERSAADWRETLRREVEQTWIMYVSHPRVLQLLITVVINEPDALSFYEVLAEALERAGLPDEEILTTIEAIEAFSIGAALDALSPEVLIDPAHSDGKLATLLPHHSSGEVRNREVFERGLELIIDGIAARVAAAAARSN
ncbi:TetR family transcriptional regulator [Leucobacter viscericola]|uniref:TetR family transcriptional regulator n=1 Tax=Leucobacter viscericola TaxID=2714935 RepID=A0A6G7XGN6_9MICO|nr:TetR/AcrR family transcriptional regulator C-terminal domain-containing protein [Leucobacter viscericola]QIK63538.1 TetR family transcriptional regulator [Leucobacter viscericola]